MPNKILYKSGNLAEVSRVGKGSILSSIPSLDSLELLYSAAAKRYGEGVIGVFQNIPHVFGPGIDEELQKAAQVLIGDAYGQPDPFHPNLISLIYSAVHSQLGFLGILPPSPIDRITIYPYDNIPDFSQKTAYRFEKGSILYAGDNPAMQRGNSLLLNKLKSDRSKYGLTQAEFIVYALLDESSPLSKSVVKSKTTQISYFFNMLEGVSRSKV